LVEVLCCADLPFLPVLACVAVVEDGTEDDEREGADDEPAESWKLRQNDDENELDGVHR